jgi:dsDNA-specific endonuclease/ATPase MutS2
MGLLRRDLREWLGITTVIHKLDYLRERVGIVVTEASELTASVDALVGENSEVKQVLSDLVAKVSQSGDPELRAAAAEATSKINAVVSDLHTAAVAAGVTSTPAPTPIPDPAPGV